MADTAISALFDGAQVPPSRNILCRQCGADFDPHGGRHSSCPACRPGFSELRACQRCECEYTATSASQKYCVDCKPIIVSEQERARSQKRKKGNLGTPFTCEFCGGTFPTKRGGQKYCDGCRRKAIDEQQGEKKKKERKDAGFIVFGETITCIDCGSSMERRAAKHKRCEQCASVETKRYMEAYRERTRPKKGRLPKKEKPRVIGSTFTCQDCDQDTVRFGGNQKRCVACQTIFRKKRDAERQRERREDPEIRAKQAARVREKPRTDAQREYANAYWKERVKNDPKVAVHKRMHAQVLRGLKFGKGGRSWQELVGYTLDELMLHLERQFSHGMSWSNRDEWHIDHIVPVASFNFSSEHDEDFKACWALTNLRPLWKRLNRKKWHERTHLI